MRPPSRPLPWLDAHEEFPAPDTAWTACDPAPGLLAAGGLLDVTTLIQAYARGIFPWFSLGQPVLWWSPDPRMVLHASDFRLHRSLRKTLSRFAAEPRCAVRFNTAFNQVIQACASQPRDGQSGTWIVPDMVRAYTALHHAGHAHSVEAWHDGELIGGLYCVSLGGMVFGESMFSRRTDASKIALAALVAFCLAQGIPMIDCQQNTAHLASLGAHEISRATFVRHIAQVTLHGVTAAPAWHFKPQYWDLLLTKDAAKAPT